MKFRPKFFWKWSFFDQNQQPLKDVEPFERTLRALFTSQCPYKFSSFLDLANASNRFRLFSRDFRLFRFCFPRSACFSTLASPWNLPSWVKYYGKFESFGKEFWQTKFIAVDRVRVRGTNIFNKSSNSPAKIESQVCRENCNKNIFLFANNGKTFLHTHLPLAGSRMPRTPTTAIRLDCCGPLPNVIMAVWPLQQLLMSDLSPPPPRRCRTVYRAVLHMTTEHHVCVMCGNVYPYVALIAHQLFYTKIQMAACVVHRRTRTY